MPDLPSCQDCGAAPGQPHGDGCDTARCLVTGYQRLSCDRSHEAGDLDCGQEVWTGEWPGVAECREFGWYAFFLPYGNPSWVRCEPDHPAATEDLNRLVSGEARWDRERRRWVLREQ